MNKRPRPNSPLSKNSIMNFARESGLNVNFEESEDESGSDRSSVVDSSSDIFADNTDKDPTFDPETFDPERPGPSGVQRLLTRPEQPVHSSDSEEDNPEPLRQVYIRVNTRPRTSRGSTWRGVGGTRGRSGRRRGPTRGRPRPTRGVGVRDVGPTATVMRVILKVMMAQDLGHRGGSWLLKVTINHMIIAFLMRK